VEQIIRDAIEYDSYSTGEVILPPGQKPLWGGAWAGGKVVETAFLWWYAADSTIPLCNNRVKRSLNLQPPKDLLNRRYDEGKEFY